MTAKGRILLVDDDCDILRGLSVRLRAAGYEVPTAQDGQAGLTAARSEHLDAIVLDLRMPGTDGFAVLAGLRASQETRGIPVVVVSANTVERSKKRALDLGARCFVEKPFDNKSLVQTLEAAIAGGHCPLKSKSQA